jgi:uroporphyrinogen-III decarboxylase
VTKKVGTMTNEERLRKTTRLQKTDKIPFAPAIIQFAATYTGISQKDFLDPVKAEEAYEKTFNGLGGWDFIMSMPSGGRTPFALKMLLPGRELPDNVTSQIKEEEIMLPDDYDYVIEHGFNALQVRLLKRTNPQQAEKEEGGRLIAEANRKSKENIDKWAARGVASLVGGALGSHPFEYFSFHRSLSKFSMDLRRMPDKVKAAVDACVPDLVENAKSVIKVTGVKRTFLANSRDAATFINTKIFEDIVFPCWLKMVNIMAADDVDTIFHCDADWLRFLPYFKEFPKGRCIVQLDGATDIFKAKEILRDHMAIFGDIPASLLTLGTPQQVTDYCKKLIKVVGEGGGFMLSTGCSLPFDAKVENVKALVKAGNELTWY